MRRTPRVRTILSPASPTVPKLELAYRPDIDGLRALAVGVVILAHAGIPGFSGGFIGVDVFFVISGFLITSILLQESHRGFVDYTLNFYNRRLRRVVPALLVVVAACLAAGFILFTAKDYAALSQSVVPVLFFFSNVHFAGKVDYFMPAAHTLPLLHTWSLGVEEQFYLVAPFAVYVMARRTAGVRTAAFVVLFLASLGVSEWGIRTEYDATYYLSQSRAFELMTGMALAGAGRVYFSRRLAREVASLAGLAMVLAATVLYSDATPFPGIAALLPAVGAALMIAGGAAGDTALARLLSRPAIVYTGKISYSLYLWHWPILAFAKYVLDRPLDPLETGAAILATVALSALTYRFVETPARRHGLGSWRPRVFVPMAAGTATLAVAGLVIAGGHGWPWRLPPAVNAIEATLVTPPGSAEARCRDAERGCVVGDANAGRTAFVVLGDSHGLALASIIDDVAAQHGLKGRLFARGGCIPLVVGDGRHAGGREKCDRMFAALLDAIEAEGVRHIVIAARWALYTEGRTIGENGIVQRPLVAGGVEAKRARLATALDDTVGLFASRGMTVDIIGPVPELTVDLPVAMARAGLRGRTFAYALPREAFEGRQAFVMARLAEQAARPGVRLLRPADWLCDARTCRAIETGQPLYTDSNHLGPLGARLVAPLIEDALRRPQAAGAAAGELSPGAPAP